MPASKPRSLYPLLLFLLSFAAIFLYSYNYNTTIINTSPPISIQTPKTMSFTIKLLAYDRSDSIHRCLRSLAAADYLSDTVDLHVFIDHFPLNSNNGSDVDRLLNNSREILDLVDGFEWKHGKKLIHYRSVNAGLQSQWIEAWWPASDDEFVFVVEDDLELSPLYYRFLKALIGRYYYDKENYSPYVYGASLQRPRFVAGKHGNKLLVDSGTRLFLYQIVGTWGQLLFPKPWKEFRLWYDTHKAKGMKPILQGMVTTGWYRKMGERIWTPWFIKFVHSRGYFNIYTNFLHERALSTSHRDAGVNYGKSAGPDSYLLDKGSLDTNLWDMQPLKNLKWYDFCFREILPRTLIKSFAELGLVLNSFDKMKDVILISLYRTTERITRNLVCHLEKINVQNYIFVGENSEFLVDLARRGHSAIDAIYLFSELRHFKSYNYMTSGSPVTAEIILKANLIKKCLEFGYGTWVVDGNVVPISDSFLKLPDHSYTFMSAKGAEIMFTRSSEESLSLWSDNLINRMADASNSFSNSDSLSGDYNFVWFAKKALEHDNVRVWTFAESMVGKIGAEVGSRSDTSLLSGKKLVFFFFWSFFFDGESASSSRSVVIR